MNLSDAISGSLTSRRTNPAKNEPIRQIALITTTIIFLNILPDSFDLFSSVIFFSSFITASLGYVFRANVIEFAAQSGYSARKFI